MVRSRKHEMRRRTEPDGTERNVPFSHQHRNDILNWLLAKMVKEAGISRDEFEGKMLGISIQRRTDVPIFDGNHKPKGRGGVTWRWRLFFQGKECSVWGWAKVY
ncbi:MAG: hypothetical protein RMK89_02910 [Armatimonadota bacterium]|nr:hypothetical protein [Armatimonadota bacterium]MDW8142393.1 hypothetical protein [Armatimonadota bacterium]